MEKPEISLEAIAWQMEKPEILPQISPENQKSHHWQMEKPEISLEAIAWQMEKPQILPQISKCHQKQWTGMHFSSFSNIFFLHFYNRKNKL